MKVTIYKDEECSRIILGKALLFIVSFFLFLGALATISGYHQILGSSGKIVGNLIIFFLPVLLIELYFHFSLWFPYPKDGFMDINKSEIRIHNDPKSAGGLQYKIQSFDKITIWLSRHLFNRITIKLEFQKGDIQIRGTIRLTNKSQNELFRSILSNWYKQGINIFEYDPTGGRSFLLNSHLSFNEIQNIKSEYHLDWQYDHKRMKNQYI